MVPGGEYCRRNQQSIFLKMYFTHLLGLGKKKAVFSSVDMAYRLAAVSQDLAGVQKLMKSSCST